MKIQIQFKNSDAIHKIINSKHPLPADDDDVTPRMERLRENFSNEYFEFAEYGRIELDTDMLVARLLPVAEWDK